MGNRLTTTITNDSWMSTELKHDVPFSEFLLSNCILQAGIIKGVDSPSLLIALEPVAASYYFISNNITGFTDENSDSDAKSRSADKMIIIDAGGNVNSLINYIF